jgi:hypothetical protein
LVLTKFYDLITNARKVGRPVCNLYISALTRKANGGVLDSTVLLDQFIKT